jgi:hypothetical protein
MNGVTALCMEPHDLCVAKLLAGREKDVAFVLALLSAGLVDRSTIPARPDDAEVADLVRERARASLQG